MQRTYAMAAGIASGRNVSVPVLSGGEMDATKTCQQARSMIALQRPTECRHDATARQIGRRMDAGSAERYKDRTMATQ